jgi:hypothetical protein
MPWTGALSSIPRYASRVQNEKADDPTPAAPPVSAQKPPLTERLKALLAEYGAVAIVLYFVIFGLVLAGFATAIAAGFDVEGAGETTGLLAGAWLATKVTQPLRILATLALTPLVARGWNRLKRRRAG